MNICPTHTQITLPPQTSLILHRSPTQHSKFLKAILDGSLSAPIPNLSFLKSGSANYFADDRGIGKWSMLISFVLSVERKSLVFQVHPGQVEDIETIGPTAVSSPLSSSTYSGLPEQIFR